MSRPRWPLAIAAGLVPAVLIAACGETVPSDAASSSGPPNTGTEYVTLPSTTTTTTTTTTTIPGATLPEPIRDVEVLHTIEIGDSLAFMAAEYGVEIDAICSYNEWDDCINPPHLLLPGDTVRIPPQTTLPPPVEGSAPVESTLAPGIACTHTIALNENPTSVATDYGITFDQLQAANPDMDFRTTFVVGDTLNIPAGGDC